MTTRTQKSYPGGAPGVALTSGIVGSVIGLLVPRAWIDELSWQLYLDRLVAAAAPPIGSTGQLVFALALGLVLALLGWLLATWLRVRPLAGGMSGLLARLRGDRTDDEPDAPYLRPMDRHPDAPARRPFSAARDVPVEDEARFTPAPAPTFEGFEENDDELLLDAHFDDGVAPLTDPVSAPAPISWDVVEHVDSADAAPPVAAVMPQAAAQADEPSVQPESAPEMPTATEPAPLDLSMARLDELIARLEAGLDRRADTAAPTRATAVDRLVDESDALEQSDEQPTPDQPAPIVQNDGDFPHDPALAAALATLRRMNRTS